MQLAGKADLESCSLSEGGLALSKLALVAKQLATVVKLSQIRLRICLKQHAVVDVNI